MKDSFSKQLGENKTKEGRGEMSKTTFNIFRKIKGSTVYMKQDQYVRK